ncbi:MAG: hypothetical protein SXQ77_09850, partial [Halobacteria archaeon]|nr:hypothetical protein [Halobacteria archaeon]
MKIKTQAQTRKEESTASEVRNIFNSLRDDTRTCYGNEDTDNEVSYLTVRILEDLPSILGTDGREYKLEQGDVVVLPERNARALLKKGGA